MKYMGIFNGVFYIYGIEKVQLGMFIMALPVMKFQYQGYIIRKIFALNQHTQRKLLNIENWTNGE